ncbi:MAG: hypothetical protein U0935_06695 [Pirellulales bacterium]
MNSPETLRRPSCIAQAFERVLRQRRRPPRRWLFIAEAFGYGPPAKLLALLPHLARDSSTTWTFLGEGCALELCRSGPFEEWVECPAGNAADPRLGAAIEAHDALVTAMEFTPIDRAAAGGKLVVVFDSLFWMWPELPFSLSRVDLCLCQNYPGVVERRASLSADEASRIVVVPPLAISRPGGWTPGETVVLNLGGMDNPFADRDALAAYATGLTRLVVDVCARAACPLEVYGRSWVMAHLRHTFPGVRATFGTLPPGDFVQRLASARCLITAPGLEVVYEAFTTGTPVFLLPPQNNSQFHQSQLLLRDVPGLAGRRWQELVDIDVGRCASPVPSEAIGELLRGPPRLLASATAQRSLREALEDFVGRRPAEFAVQCAAQTHFLDTLRSGADH